MNQRQKKLLMIVFCLSVAFFYIRPAYAFTQNIVQLKETFCSTCATITLAYTSNVASGNTLVIAGSSYHAGANDPSFACSDSKGNTWTQNVVADDEQSGVTWNTAFICSAPVTHAGADTAQFVANSCGGCNPVALYINIYEVKSPNVVLTTATGICHSSCGTNIQTSTSPATGNVQIADGTWSGVVGSSCRGGLGFAVCTGSLYCEGGALWPSSCTEGISNQGASEYNQNISSVTNFPFTASGAPVDYVDVGVVMGIQGTTTATTFIPPPQTSLQYWIFPIFFLGLYDAYFLTHAMIAKVSTKGLIYIMLTGFALGSVVGLLMGFLGIQLIILSVLSLFVWWWRFR